MFSFKGFLQVWARESAVDVHVHGIDVMSRLEGRIYEVRLPDGSILIHQTVSFHRPSNSIVPVAWITEPTTDSQLL